MKQKKTSKTCMPKNLIPMAICYDFDGTLSPGNMQEYGFIKRLGVTPEAFWGEMQVIAQAHKSDPILTYMKLMIEKSKEHGLSFKRADFQDYGKTVKLFPGVETWFKRTTAYARKMGIKLDHYVISSGMKEIIEGTKIAKDFREIYASYFMYNHQGQAEWPALTVNYTTKTQFLYRVNKGALDVTDSHGVNKRMPRNKRAVPYENMIFMGDGETDIPCMSMMGRYGGYAVAVYQPHNPRSKKTAEALIRDRRVDLAAIADYSEGKALDVFIKTVMDKIVTDYRLQCEMEKGMKS